MLNRYFGSGGKKKKDDATPPPTLQDTSKKMDARTQAMEEKIRRLDVQIMDLKKKMKKARGSSKRSLKQRALKLLKQKKMYESQLDNVMQQQFNIDQTQFMTENLKDTATMVSAMKEAQVQIKKQYEEVDIDEIEDMHDDMQDLMYDMEEMNEVMGRGLGMDDYDEDDLLDELNEMDDEMDMLGDEDELPDYLTNTEPAAANTSTNEELDEFGLPKVQATMTV